MTTKVEKSVLVNVPVSTAYNQWTQFEDFPQFMSGVKSVTQLGDDRLEWVAEIAGVRRQWEARILEQIPDQKIAWAATEGATNAGAVTFQDVGGGQTSVHLSLEYEPEGLVEKVGDKLNVVESQAEGDLDRFKEFIESEGYATGAWRGAVSEGMPVSTPGVEDAYASEGDSGKAGVSGKAVAAGVGLAAAGVAAAVAANKGDDEDEATSTPLADTGRTETFPATGTVSAGAAVTPTDEVGYGEEMSYGDDNSTRDVPATGDVPTTEAVAATEGTPATAPMLSDEQVEEGAYTEPPGSAGDDRDLRDDRDSGPGATPDDDTDPLLGDTRDERDATIGHEDTDRDRGV